MKKGLGAHLRGFRLLRVGCARHWIEDKILFVSRDQN